MIRGVHQQHPGSCLRASRARASRTLPQRSPPGCYLRAVALGVGRVALFVLVVVVVELVDTSLSGLELRFFLVPASKRAISLATSRGPFMMTGRGPAVARLSLRLADVSLSAQRFVAPCRTGRTSDTTRTGGLAGSQCNTPVTPAARPGSARPCGSPRPPAVGPPLPPKRRNPLPNPSPSPPTSVALMSTPICSYARLRCLRRGCL